MMSDHIFAAPPSRHGYNTGCRCDGCVEAHRAYMRAYMRGVRDAERLRREEESRQRAARRAEYRGRITP